MRLPGHALRAAVETKDVNHRCSAGVRITFARRVRVKALAGNDILDAVSVDVDVVSEHLTGTRMLGARRAFSPERLRMLRPSPGSGAASRWGVPRPFRQQILLAFRDVAVADAVPPRIPVRSWTYGNLVE